MLTKFKDNQRKERWKDTPFRKILNVEWQAPAITESAAPINETLPENAVVLPIYNGEVSKRWISDLQLPEGLLVRADGNKLDLHLVEGAELSRPVVIYHYSEATETPIQVSAEISLKADAGSEGSFLMHEAGQGQYLNTAKVRVDVAENAKIEWVRSAENDMRASSVLDFQSEQAKESAFHYVSYQASGDVSRSDVGIRMNGEDAFGQLHVLNIGDERQHIAHVVDMDHAVPNCESNQQVKNILKNRAESVFDAQIHVYKDAQKINADQMTRSLILDDGARALTIPRLLIYADDVRCTHGATVGYLEPEQMFYLRSRGISETEARAMLMRGYGAEIIEGVENLEIREWLMHLLDKDIAKLV